MSKPTNKPGWNPADPSKLEEPSSIKKQQGWSEGEKPSSKHFNWLMKTTSEWVDYVDSDVASKAYVDSAVNGHATSSEVQEAKDYADAAIASGVQEAKSYADSAVANLVNSAPAALDTLNELAVALGNDANFSTSITNALSNKADSSEVESALALKANASDVSSALALKADASEVTTSLATKASASDLAAEVSRAQVAESGKASTRLNNLANTAVNADIVPASGLANYYLGSDDKTWGLKLFRAKLYGPTPTPVGDMIADVFEGFQLSGVNYSAITVRTEDKSSVSSNSSSVNLKSGNATGATSNSGDISLTTGTATGTRGKISLSASQIDVSSAIIPTSNNTIDLGSGSNIYSTVWANQFIGGYGGLNNNKTTPSGTSSAVSLYSYDNVSRPVAVYTGNKSATSTNSASVYIESGNATGTTSNSGDILLTTGTATGTRGKISLNASQIDLAASVVPTTANSIDIGSGSSRLRSGYFQTSISFGNGFLQNSNASPSGVTSFILSCGQGALPVSVCTGSKSSGDGSSNAILIESGNSSDSNSGDISLTTGTATGTRGKISLNAGYVETSSDIIPDAHLTRSLGSSAKRFSSVYATSLIGNSGGVYSQGMPSGVSGWGIYIPASVASPAAIHTGSQANNSTNSQAVRLETGNATGATSNSGDISLTTGTATGTRGKISLSANTVDVNSTRIINVATPTASTDACTKGYADSLIQIGLGTTIEMPVAKEYVILEYAFRAMTVDSIAVRCGSGSATVRVRISTIAANGTTSSSTDAVFGASSDVSVTDVRALVSATSANSVSIGQRISIMVSNVNAATDLSFSVKVL